MPLLKKFGKGETGPKSASLFHREFLLAKSGFKIPPTVAYTPAFCKRLLDESGASGAKTLSEAQRRISEYIIKGAEKDAIEEGVRCIPLSPNMGIMVRTDEYPAGIGLGKSGAATIGTSSFNSSKIDIKLLLARVQAHFKKALASEFTESMQIFKQMKGMKGNMGVMLMSIVGEVQRIGTAPFLLPALSLNCIAQKNGRVNAAFGAGLDGANNTTIAKQWSEGQISPEALVSALKSSWAHAVNLKNGKTGREPTDKLYSWFHSMSISENQFSNLNSRLKKIASSAGTSYLELALESTDSTLWWALQAATVDAPKLLPPKVQAGGMLLSSNNLVGTKIARADKIRKILTLSSPDKLDSEFNQQNTNYLLVIGAGTALEFKKWQLNQFSNAAAVVINGPDNNAYSHLGGLPRELNIPVFVGDFDSKSLFANIAHYEFENGRATLNAKTIIYADEFHPDGPRGFVALNNLEPI